MNYVPFSHGTSVGFGKCSSGISYIILLMVHRLDLILDRLVMIFYSFFLYFSCSPLLSPALFYVFIFFLQFYILFFFFLFFFYVSFLILSLFLFYIIFLNHKKEKILLLFRMFLLIICYSLILDKPWVSHTERFRRF